MGEYIKPVQAFKKLDAAKLLRQSVYIYGAAGFGKTELIRQYFKNQRYIYILCQQNSCDLSLIPEDYADVVVIDNVNAIEDEEMRGEIVSLFSRKKFWLLTAGCFGIGYIVADSEAVLAEGQSDNTKGDTFNLVTVIYSVVLFMLGIVGTFRRLPNRMLITIIAIAGFIFGTIYMFTIPFPTGFNFLSFFGG